MKRLLITAIIAIAFINLSAQVITRTTDSHTINNIIKLSDKAITKSYKLPKVDREKLLAEDDARKSLALPFRFGHIFEVNFSMMNSGEWFQTAEGRVWVLKISSVDAFSINLSFDKLFIPKGSQLYIYNSEKTVIQGPITWENNTPDGQFATDLIPGSEIILEYFEPHGTEEKGVVSISEVIHGYINLFSDPSKGFGDSASCNIDINCPEGDAWQAESNSVAMIIVGSNGICSGALINNACQNFIPYFLTANHCVQGQNVGNFMFRFGYKSPTCNGGDSFHYYSYFGSTLRANAAISDFALLELNQRPNGNTGITFAGWFNQNIASNSGASVTHPRGDVMKIATYTETITRQTFLNSLDWNVIWENGTVEPGSSGGPLFNNEHRIIGQVHGGNPMDICTSNDNAFFGRFDISWNNGLAEWLDPNNTGIVTTNTISSPSISGPTTVCSSWITYSLSNVPEGYTVSWDVSGNLLSTGCKAVPGSSCIRVKAADGNYNGPGWVQATISGPCGDVELPPHDVWVGTPMPSLIQGPYYHPGMQSVCKGISHTMEVFSSITADAYQWELVYPNGLPLILPSTGSSASFCTDAVGWYTAKVRQKLDGCSWSAESTKTFAVENCGTGASCSDGPIGPVVPRLIISPNPTTARITISEVKPTNDNIPWVLRLMSGRGAVMVNVTTTLPRTINVQGLQPGVYVLHARRGQHSEQQVVVVE